MATVGGMQRKPAIFSILDANHRDAAVVSEVVEAAFQPLHSFYRPTSQTIQLQAIHSEKGPDLSERLTGALQAGINSTFVPTVCT